MRLIYILFLVFTGLLAAATSSASNYNKQDFINLLRAKKPTSIVNVLKMLPISFRSRHILIFDSLSVQNAEPLFPRVLLANKDASFVIAFNGKPSQAGYEAIETMQFNFVQAKFEFEEFIFSDDHKERLAHLTKAGNQEFIKSFLDRSNSIGVNPPKCLACHRQDPRPNWEPYNFWPGVYGQFDDHPFETASDPHANFSKGLDNKQVVAPLKEFVRLAKRKRHQALRYNYLKDIEAQIRVKPLRKYAIHAQTVRMPLNRFTQDLARLNFKRVVRIFRANPNYELLKYKLTSLLSCLNSKPPGDYSMPSVREVAFYMLEFKNFNSLFAPYGIPVSDLYMNYLRGEHNEFTTPGAHHSEFQFELAIQDKDLAPLFEFQEEPASASYYVDYGANLRDPEKNCAVIYSRAQ